MLKRCARVGSDDFNAFPGPIPDLPLQMTVNSRFPSYQGVFSGRTELQVLAPHFRTKRMTQSEPFHASP